MNEKKIPTKQEQKDQQPQQHELQQQKTKQMPKKVQKPEVFHEQERIETRMTR